MASRTALLNAPDHFPSSSLLRMRSWIQCSSHHPRGLICTLSIRWRIGFQWVASKASLLVSWRHGSPLHASAGARLAQMASKSGTDAEHLVKDAALWLLEEEARFLAAIERALR